MMSWPGPRVSGDPGYSANARPRAD